MTNRNLQEVLDIRGRGNWDNRVGGREVKERKESFLAHSSNMKAETACSSETTVHV
jgi:hypothetical protein